jgi:predicted metal-dependent hydrolase
MAELLRLDDPPLTVRLRRNRRARRFTLSVSHVDGSATLTIPHRARLAEARMFLLRQSDWLAGAVDRAPSTLVLTPGARLPYRGREVVLAAPGGRTEWPSVEGDVLTAPGPAHRAPTRALAFLKNEARAELARAAHHYAERLGREVRKITLRDPKSRWGSCTSRGDLSFSWRLIMAPPAVLDYVAAHEASHLVEMNHSPRFWAVVDGLKPGWKAERDWLKKEGAKLHRVTFG